ncbi:DUF221-domain-containing protein [Metschnikowia bicuspidata var. bicuspidata NRRL YB-4993]|uniref:DUF221-domain-containing protein n=1 Tax=Metschnikowia bicuspidata var. bicuspidata NRRL YB-4993 TaxID=869754 RepID=A0A1A0H6M0_9ASCO|nr:DUF221-domain-containing protein [Metschnikowia bicuspidata var. bicuspidata NRRL YB-4993]OBA19558.1 DUF221-domain-containing protein [Metschnikowia bicuspidata var. bicuspidata NRRL YB-4993]
MATTESNSSTSASQLLSSLIPNLIIFAVFMLIFLLIRKKNSRVYEPRNTVKTVPKDLQPEESPKGAFAWVTALFKKPQSYLIQQTGPDGYFFLRYLLEFCFVCLLGCFITWPVLFPVDATNSNGNQQLDMLTYGNVKDKWRYFAHVFISWLFFGAVLFVIYRELVYYTTFRHALQTTPIYDSLLSSRTLLLTEIPTAALEELTLREYFPTATNLWYARDYKELKEKVKERTKLAKKYEGALNGSIIKANKLRLKCEKKGEPVPEPVDDLDKYLKDGKKRPTHKLKFLIGKKVDTLNYGVERLGELNREIEKEQSQHNARPQHPSVFIEFPTQLEMQKAYQALPYHKELKKAGKHVGLAPEDVIWENLALTTTKRRVKKIIASTVLTLTIIFWSIPVAIVGAISNINFIIEKLPFLDFINNMPTALLGIITSLLPTVALAILMSLVPPFIKKMGKISGCITIQQVEKYCQNWYYAFQAVNSFLVVTLASAAVSSIQTIIEDPTSALTLLAEKLPKASNFYISYLCLYGLTFSSGAILQIVALILSKILGRILDKTPRSKWNRATTLRQPFFSVLYPAFQFVALIAICYAIIAPLILGFATITFLLIFIAFMYNLIHVMRPNTTDARGRNYPLAMFQMFVAIYLSEVLLVALFVFGKNWACVVLEAVFIAFTVACHLYFKWKFIPLFEAVPISALKYAAGDRTFQYPMHDQGLKEIKTEGENYWQGGNQLGLTNQKDQVVPEISALAETTELPAHDETDINTAVTEEKLVGADPEDSDSTPCMQQKSKTKSTIGGTIKRFFRPKRNTFDMVRESMPDAYFNYIQYNPDFVRTAYEDPAVNDEEPHIWVVKDSMGLSEIEKNKALENGVDCSDADACFDDKGKTQYLGPPPSYEESIKV